MQRKKIAPSIFLRIRSSNCEKLFSLTYEIISARTLKIYQINNFLEKWEKNHVSKNHWQPNKIFNRGNEFYCDW